MAVFKVFAFFFVLAVLFSLAETRRLPVFSELKGAYPADDKYGGRYPGRVLMSAIGADNTTTTPNDTCPLRISTMLNLIRGHAITQLPYGVNRNQYHYNTFKNAKSSFNMYFMFDRDGLVKHLVRMYGLPLESWTPTSFNGMKGIMVLNITQTTHVPCSALLWDSYNFYQAYGYLQHTNLSRVYFWQTPDESCQINVKNDGGSSGGLFCFPSTSKVELESGEQVSMKDLQIGQRVKTMTKHRTIKYTPVITFLDKSSSHRGQYLTIMTSSGIQITMKPAHLIFRIKPDMTSQRLYKPEAIHAAKIRPGDLIYTQSYDKTRADRVVGVAIGSNEGAYAPVTEEGTLFVDDALVSCFADFEDHDMAHYLMGPFRVFYYLAPNSVGAKGHYIHGFLRDIFRPVAVRLFGKERFYRELSESYVTEGESMPPFKLKLEK